MDINGNIEELDKIDSSVTLHVNRNSGVTPSTSFPIIQRPSGLLPRQNSGINAILDTDLMMVGGDLSNKDDGSSTLLQTSGNGQIRNSYEQPSITSRVHPHHHHHHVPLRLSKILHQCIRQGTVGGRPPSVLNKGFLESVGEQVRTIKSRPFANESEFSLEQRLPTPKFSEPFSQSAYTIHSNLDETCNTRVSSRTRPVTTNVSNSSVSQDRSKLDTSVKSTSNEIGINGKDAANVNINLTLKLSPLDRNSFVGYDLNSSSHSHSSAFPAEATKSTSASITKVESSMQTEAAECQKNEDKGISSPDCDGSSKSLDSISIVFDPSAINVATESSGCEQETFADDNLEKLGPDVKSVLSAELVTCDEPTEHCCTTETICTSEPSAMGINSIKEIPKEENEISSVLELTTDEKTEKIGQMDTTEIESSLDYSEDAVSKEDSTEFMLATIANALEITGGRMKTAASSTLSLLANLVSMDVNTEFDEETMNALESDLPIKLMRILGVPKNLRHTIYSEACGEVEVLQDLGTGTYGALTTVIKWICGGKKGREDFLSVMRTLSSVHTEVDFDSEVWNELSKQVESITETVDNVILDNVDAAEILGDSLVDFVTSVTTLEMPSELTDMNVECKNENDTKTNQEDFMTSQYIEDGKSDQQTNGLLTTAEIVDINNNYLVYSNSQQFVPCTEDISNNNRGNFHEYLKNVNDPIVIKSSGTDESLLLQRAEPIAYESSSLLQYKINPNVFRQQLDNTQRDLLGISENKLSTEMNNVERIGDDGPIDNDDLLFPHFLDEHIAESAEPARAPQNLQSFFSNRTVNTTKHQSIKPMDEQPRFINPVNDDLNPSVSSSSVAFRNKLPQAPPNSEFSFDRMKHDDKVIKDMSKISKLVHQLYQDLIPPVSKKLSVTKTTSKPEPLPSRIPVPRATLKPLATPRMKISLVGQPSQNCIPTASVSTVSLYHASRATDSDRSFIQSNPLAKQDDDQNAKQYQNVISTCTYNCEDDDDQLSVAPTVGSSSHHNYSKTRGGRSSFLQPTISSINKAKLRLNSKLSIATTGSSTSLTRNISTTSNACITQNWVAQKLSTSSMESNATYSLDDNKQSSSAVQMEDYCRNKPQDQISSYQQMYQKKNISIAKQCMKSFSQKSSSSPVSTSAKPRFVQF
ncbi:hypothetical protein Fcan01_05464 [Folsomia candida]|uniref:Uncharacterized protein n=1 Tax=Folsomia candida TaxID=158441 RepID=A0A226ER51_FOLCA|nr:hypothetical protein Fcan01_05464 [Folsomia candida]